MDSVMNSVMEKDLVKVAKFKGKFDTRNEHIGRLVLAVNGLPNKAYNAIPKGHRKWVESNVEIMDKGFDTKELDDLENLDLSKVTLSDFPDDKKLSNKSGTEKPKKAAGKQGAKKAAAPTKAAKKAAAPKKTAKKTAEPKKAAKKTAVPKEAVVKRNKKASGTYKAIEIIVKNPKLSRKEVVERLEKAGVTEGIGSVPTTYYVMHLGLEILRSLKKIK